MSARVVLVVVPCLVALGSLASPRAAVAEQAWRTGRPSQVMVEAAERTYAAVRARFEAGSETLETVYVWSLRWLEAQRTARPTAAAAAARDHHRRMQELCALVDRQVAAGTLDGSAASACQYYLAQAEVRLQER